MKPDMKATYEIRERIERVKCNQETNKINYASGVISKEVFMRRRREASEALHRLRAEAKKIRDERKKANEEV